MATFHRTANGAAYLNITCEELSGYSGMERPVCDECLQSLVDCQSITLVPILNEAYCPKCSTERLARIRRYPEDRPIEERREQFWKNYFGIQEEEAPNG